MTFRLPPAPLQATKVNLLNQSDDGQPKFDYDLNCVEAHSLRLLDERAIQFQKTVFAENVFLSRFQTKLNNNCCFKGLLKCNEKLKKKVICVCVLQKETCISKSVCREFEAICWFSNKSETIFVLSLHMFRRLQRRSSHIEQLVAFLSQRVQQGETLHKVGSKQAVLSDWRRVEQMQRHAANDLSRFFTLRQIEMLHAGIVSGRHIADECFNSFQHFVGSDKNAGALDELMTVGIYAWRNANTFVGYVGQLNRIRGGNRVRFVS